MNIHEYCDDLEFLKTEILTGLRLALFYKILKTKQSGLASIWTELL